MRRGSRHRSRPVTPDAVYEAIDCCANIAALAGLLEAGRAASLHPTSEAVSRAGYMIGREAEKLRDLVRCLEKEIARPSLRR